MIVRSTTFAGKGIVLGASAAAHAAFFLAAHGAHSVSAAGFPRTTSAEIQIEAMHESPAPDELLPNEGPTVPHAHAHAHTHPYPVPADHDLVPHDPSLEHAHAPSSPHAIAIAAPAGAGAVVAAEALPRFTIAIAPGGVSAGTSPGSPSVSAGAPVADDDDAPVAAAAVDTPARRVRGSDPVYPVEARRDGVEADVQLVLVVSRAGAVESVQTVRRAGHGFDEAAIAAARGFRFTTAMKGGRSVRVRLPWTFTFRLE